MTKVPDWVVQTAELGEAFELCVHKDEGCGQAFDKITPGVLPFSQLRLQFASAHTSRSTTVTPWQGTGIDLLLHIAVAGAASSQASPEAGSWMRLHIGLRMTQERLVVSSVVCFECLRFSLNGDYARLRRHPHGACLWVKGTWAPGARLGTGSTVEGPGNVMLFH